MKTKWPIDSAIKFHCTYIDYTREERVKTRKPPVAYAQTLQIDLPDYRIYIQIMNGMN